MGGGAVQLVPLQWLVVTNTNFVRFPDMYEVDTHTVHKMVEVALKPDRRFMYRKCRALFTTCEIYFTKN